MERGDGPKAVAAAMRAHREEILTTFIARSRLDPEVPHADGLSERALRDHAPRVLDELAALLDRCAETGCSPEEAGRALAESASPERHAWQRLSEQYDLAEILRELSLLRTSIDDVLIVHLALDRTSLRVIHTALDETMISGAVAAHEADTARIRQQEGLHRDEALLRERLMAVLGHDLRQPLNTVSMAAGLLLQQDSAEPARTRFYQTIARATRRMSAMIESLLDVARIRAAGGIPVVLQQMDLREVVDRVADEVALSRGEGRLRVSGASRCAVRGDPERLAQVVSNLIANAIDHGAPDREVVVTIEADPANVTIAVCNQNGGARISPERLAQIFEPFERGKGGPSTGLGLGLYIAREIVRGHSGDISVSSDLERTIFRVELPRSPVLP